VPAVAGRVGRGGRGLGRPSVLRTVRAVLRQVEVTTGRGYLPSDGFTALNTISTIGAFLLGVSTIPLFWNSYHSYRFGEVVTADDPWGHGNSLEWATSCPPPRHNFTRMPRIRSERPAFELHYPHLTERLEQEAHSTGSNPLGMPKGDRCGLRSPAGRRRPRPDLTLRGNAARRPP
jgi:heme/copper-type cytochrome/quinol oxidase subunit 1